MLSRNGAWVGMGVLAFSLVATGARAVVGGGDGSVAAATSTTRPVTFTTSTIPTISITIGEILVGDGNDESVTAETVGEYSGTTTSVGALPPTTDHTDGGLNPLGGNDDEDKLMPDLVCRDLQAAQDEIQDHGVFFSKSVDASGKGRRQIWDRNWVVVSQTPAPGEPIGEGDAVLYVLKDDEDHGCG